MPNKRTNGGSGDTVMVSQAPQSFGEELFMHQGLNDINLQILRQEVIDHMLLLPPLLSWAGGRRGNKILRDWGKVAQCNAEMLCVTLSCPQALVGFGRSRAGNEASVLRACPQTPTTHSEGRFHLPHPHCGDFFRGMFPLSSSSPWCSVLVIALF